MFNPENAIKAKDLHVDSFKYQSTEEMPSDAYASWEDEHPHAKVFKLEFRNIGESNEWQEMEGLLLLIFHFFLFFQLTQNLFILFSPLFNSCIDD